MKRSNEGFGAGEGVRGLGANVLRDETDLLFLGRRPSPGLSIILFVPGGAQISGQRIADVVKPGIDRYGYQSAGAVLEHGISVSVGVELLPCSGGHG